jgi:hypothetical protein
LRPERSTAERTGREDRQSKFYENADILGEVIDTSTLKVITTLSTLAQTKKSIEVDWRNGVPIATSGRTGVGYVK